jgi:hypothetical protein
MEYHRLQVKRIAKKTVALSRRPRMWFVTVTFLLLCAIVTGLFGLIAPNPFEIVNEPLAEALAVTEKFAADTGDVKHVPQEFWRALLRELNETLPGDKRMSLFFRLLSASMPTLILTGVLMAIAGLVTVVLDYGYRACCLSVFRREGTSLEALFAPFRRILTVLGDATLGEGHTNAELSIAKLSPTARSQAIEKLKIAFTLLFTVFGVPSVFYGDEAGLEGYRDPFCRRPFPWGREERVLVDTVRQLGQLRIKHPALATGDFTILHHGAHSIAYERRCENDRLLVAANMSDEPLPLTIPGRWLPIDADTSAKSSRSLTILPHQACIYKEVRA